MRCRTALLLLVVLPLTALPVAGQTGGRAFVPADWHRVTTVSAPAMSPDGRRVAFTVTTVVEAQNKRHSEVWVANTTGGDPVRFTSPSVESSIAGDVSTPLGPPSPPSVAQRAPR